MDEIKIESARHSSISLTYLDQEIESIYEQQSAPGRTGGLRLGLWLSLAINLTFGLVLIGGSSSYFFGHHLYLVIFPNALQIVVALLFAYVANKAWQVATVGTIANVISGLLLLLAAILTNEFDRFSGVFVIFLGVFGFLILRLRFIHAALASAILLATYDVLRVISGGPFVTLIIDLANTNCIVGALGLAAYLLESADREAFFQSRQSERLLLNILPRKIATRLQQGETTIVEAYEDASVLFADLVGFTGLAERLTASETAGLLNNLFSEFDDLAQRHRLEKIKTIGDAYMLVGGVTDLETNHLQETVQIGLEMIEAVSNLAIATQYELALRVGIHSGPLTAGVIGKHKFSFDVWGDTVNTASRMESQGVVGRVQVTAKTWLKLAGDFTGEYHGLLNVKGKGAVETWLVEPKLEPRD